MKKLLAHVATVLVCLCFLVNVDKEKQTMIFCNETEYGGERNLKGEIEEIMGWQKDDTTCKEECSFWRVLKLKPSEVICTEIKYNYGNKEI